MEELRAYFALLLAERNRLTTVVSREHRQLTPDEMIELSRVMGAIAAMAQTLDALAPPRPTAPSAAEDDDDAPDEKYKTVAAAAYASFREGAKLAAELQGDYGKWLVTSVAAVNFGGIYLISTSEFLDQATKSAGIWPLVVGTVLIFLAGLAAWSNWGALARAYDRFAKPVMLVDPDSWPKNEENEDLSFKIKLTYWTSIVLGIAALLCMPVSAYLVL
jgi:hypothetical protein